MISVDVGVSGKARFRGTGAMPQVKEEMLDGWTDSDLMGCWTDVYDDDHEEMQACEANSVPRSARWGYVPSTTVTNCRSCSVNQPRG